MGLRGGWVSIRYSWNISPVIYPPGSRRRGQPGHSLLPSIPPSIFSMFNRHRPVILTHRLARPYSFYKAPACAAWWLIGCREYGSRGSVTCCIDGWLLEPRSLSTLGTSSLSPSFSISVSHTPLTWFHLSVGWGSMFVVLMEWGG